MKPEEQALKHGHWNKPKNRTHCLHGHEMTEENTYRQPKTGYVQCKACNKTKSRNGYRKKSIADEWAEI